MKAPLAFSLNCDIAGNCVSIINSFGELVAIPKYSRASAEHFFFQSSLHPVPCALLSRHETKSHTLTQIKRTDFAFDKSIVALQPNVSP